tara:strand:+ start:391 stop:1134 length:744 start_codon:yes stop_codon:yes gene_type:complete
MKLTKKNLTKFSKQIILKKVGISGQKKIFNTKVLVIGVGGLGCPLISYLANSGVGNIGLVDKDKVSLSNLNRQILFSKNDIGKYKVDVAKMKIHNIDKNIKVKIYNENINRNNVFKIIKNYEIVCDGTDNFESRYLINDYCLRLKKILISAAINRFDGHLYKFNFRKKTPCYRCFMPNISEVNNNCGSDGIIPPIAGLMGSMQAFEVIKTILNTKPDLASKIVVFDGIKFDMRKIRLPINKKCINKC